MPPANHVLCFLSEMEGKAKTADELFQKTKTQPAIYFAPLTDEQV